MRFFGVLLAILAVGCVHMAESFWIHVPKEDGRPSVPPGTTAAPVPETTAAAEPESTAATEPETTAAAEPETTAAAEPVTKEAAKPESTAAAEPETTTAAAIETETKTVPAYSCAGKADGLYGVGCSEIIVSCVDGSIMYLRCPKDLMFDSVSEKCLEAEYVEACGGKATTVASAAPANTEMPASEEPMGPATEAPSMEPASEAPSMGPASEAPSMGPASEAPSMEPASEAPSMGPASEAPSMEPTSEASSMGPASEAPSMKPASETPSMEPASEAPSVEPASEAPSMGPASEAPSMEPASEAPSMEPASEAPSMGPTSEVPSIASEGPDMGPASEAPVTVPTSEATTVVRPEFSCEGKADGVYSMGCSSMFVSCLSGTTSFMQCPSGLKYDSELALCEKDEYVTECGGTPATTPKAQAPPEFSCEDKEDGIYSMGCSGTFVSCLEGLPTYLQCPANLMYDSASARCLMPENVAACGGSPTTMEPVAATVSATESATTTMEAPAEQSTEAPMETPAGQASEAPMGATAPVQSTEAPVETTAPAQASEPPAETTAPAEASEAPMGTTAPAQASEAPMETTAAPAQEGSTAKPAGSRPGISCAGLPSGIYSFDCSRSFVFCISGRPSWMKCTPGSVFDSETQKCVPLEAMPKCQLIGASLE